MLCYRLRQKVEDLGMFKGEYAHNIDKKGRIIVPARFREELGDVVTVTKGFDNCLYVYTPQQYEEMYQQILKLPETNRDVRRYQRSFLTSAWDCEFDNQGRITLPSKLVLKAGLIKECMVLGVGNHLEIWDKEKWIIEEEESDKVYDEIAENLTEYLL